MAFGRKIVKTFDYYSLILVLLFLAFGLLMVYESSSASALVSFRDKFYFLKEQMKWIVVGLTIGTFAFFFDYRRLKLFALPILVGSLVLLVSVFLPGIGVKAYGAHRWINLGFTILQPSELAKMAIIIYLSTWLIGKERKRLAAFFLLIGTFAGLIILEPDMGTAIIILGTSLVIFFLSESDLRWLIFTVPLAIAILFALAIFSPYRFARITSFLNPEADPLKSSYHVRQAIISLGSGGFMGVGLGNSRQKYSYLPEASTDSIFAIIGEELGFVGAAGFIVILYYFYSRCFQITKAVEDPFGRLLGLGILAWLTLQTIINLGSMVALMPLTGVPLPFISYGGSALVVELTGFGIVLNIWKQNLK